MRRLSEVTKEELLEAIGKSNSLEEVVLNLGFKRSGNTSCRVSKKIREFNLSTESFENWNSKRKIPTTKLLIKNSRTNNQVIKTRILKEGLIKYQCDICGNCGSHNEKALTLQLDHKDGDKRNNTLENLRLLCPNCHSQTETFSGKNIRKRVRYLADQ